MAKTPTTRRRMTRDELTQPDEVIGKLQDSYDWLNRYRWVILGGVGALVVVGAAWSIWSSMSSGKSEVVSAAFDKALWTTAAPVLPGDEEVPDVIKQQGIQTFKTEDARVQASIAALEAFLKEHDGTSLGDMAKALQGAARFDKGEFQAAADAVSAWLATNEEHPMALVLHEEVGIALAALGKTGDAASHFEKLVAAPDWWFKANGHMRLGDLYSPLLDAKGADKAKAIASYKAAVEALPKVGDDDDIDVAIAPRFLKEELEKRISMLQ